MLKQVFLLFICKSELLVFRKKNKESLMVEKALQYINLASDYLDFKNLIYVIKLY